MNKEEKEAIEDIRERVKEYEHYDMATFFTKDVRKLFEIIDKQQKEIEELYEVLEEWINGERYNDIFYISKDKIRELKEKVEKEMISNPYDFSYMINELLGDRK